MGILFVHNIPTQVIKKEDAINGMRKSASVVKK